MSHFICEHCGTEILEDKHGFYITECEHYPMEHWTQEEIEAAKNEARRIMELLNWK